MFFSVGYDVNCWVKIVLHNKYIHYKLDLFYVFIFMNQTSEIIFYIWLRYRWIIHWNDNDWIFITTTTTLKKEKQVLQLIGVMYWWIKQKFHHPTNDAILKCNCMKLFFTLHRMLLATWKTWKKETRVVDILLICYRLKIYYWTVAH